MGARRCIEVITESARQKIPFTHFLCFPFYESNLEKKVDEFKVKVLKDCGKVGFYQTHVSFFFKCYNRNNHLK